MMFDEELPTKNHEAAVKKIYIVELSVSKTLLPNLIELVREWLAENRCKAVRIAHQEKPDGVIVISFSFAVAECAKAFRYAFERS